ncbi:MAG TPA: TetR/AcrR family transcriptional regulator [Kofleriaceae bacterium]|nr:TetR/AcrR family transcriptional regulator [Kofleriaceae bacterium]
MPPRVRALRPRRPDAAAPAAAPRAPARPREREDGERKRDATRRLILEEAQRLFRDRGVDATTMRDIAQAAGLSLGAAYYHFPSKEALVFAFYEDNQARFEALAEREGDTASVRARLGALLHGSLDEIASQRAMLASIIHHLVNPGDPLSAFSHQTRAVRGRAVAVFRRVLAGSGLPPPAVAAAAHALWMLHLACMLVFIHDDTPGGARTHGLVDDGLDLVVPLLPFLGTAPGVALCERATQALARAGIELLA